MIEPTMKILFKVLTIIPKNEYPKCVGLIIVMIVGAMLEAVGIGAILPLISVIDNENFLAEHPELQVMVADIGIEGHINFVIFISLVLILLYIMKNLYIAWEYRLQIRFSTRNQICYSRELLAEYLTKPYLFHVNSNSATLIRNVNSGALVTFNMMMVAALQLLTELVTALTIWAMLIVVDAFTAIVVAGVLGGILLAVLGLFRRRIVNQGITQSKSQAQYLKWVNQGLGAVKETKVMHKEKFFITEFGKAYNGYGNAQGKFVFLSQIPRTIIEATVVSGLLLLIVVKLLLGESPSTIVPLLGVLALAAFRLMPSANRIVGFVNTIKFQTPFFNEIYPEFYRIRQRIEKSETIAMEDTAEKMPFKSELTVADLGFHYPDGNAVLEDVSFTIPKGKFVGIVGPSGAGKTTFVDILLGLLTPSQGHIYVDGRDIQADIRGWQENIAYVPQSIYLIDGSVKENIALGTPLADIDEARINKVLKMAELYDFVQDMTDGVNTMVGERGVRLSGGQRQRIGIARALYQEPEVLILDEATSALDNETEKSITETILKLKGQITIISIAHRVSTLEECDFKVKFDEGKATILNNG